MINEWADGHVLVTGGASFIGSHLVEDLVEHGANVRVADDFSSGKAQNLTVVKDEFEIVKGNLKRLSFAEAATDGIDTVFDLATDHGGRGYISNYPANCATNMALDNVVYEAAAQNCVARICFPSNACTYPTDIQ
jgi:UDP-glucose 4-epimerase